ncbi:hypothetical protein DRO61_01150 [Candidatus Bathyarchaeota archaeon]|nr:MAG: hypothetical protein DRO61_01150 [Candidatus Bathyarchaeota archaeon]
MNINILELMDIQRDVNKKVMEKIKAPITGDQFILAFNIELFEYFNAVGTWKWWKHNHEIKREEVLDELADCFAFFLSAIDLESELAKKEGIEDFIEQVEFQINEFVLSLEEYEANVENIQQVITELITYIGTDNEVKGITTVERFAIAVFIATVLFPEITWDEITDAYKKKSKVNKERQEEGY